MADNSNLHVTLAGKNGSMFVIEGPCSVCAQVHPLQNQQLVLVDLSMVVPRSQVEDLLRCLAEEVRESGPANKNKAVATPDC